MSVFEVRLRGQVDSCTTVMCVFGYDGGWANRRRLKCSPGLRGPTGRRHLIIYRLQRAFPTEAIALNLQAHTTYSYSR